MSGQLFPVRVFAQYSRAERPLGTATTLVPLEKRARAPRDTFSPGYGTG